MRGHIYAGEMWDNGLPNDLTPPDPSPQVTSYSAGASAASGPNIFTDVAFETGVLGGSGGGAGGTPGGGPCRVFVSAASGAVFEINYHT